MAYENERTPDQERLYATIKLMAENDGDAYRADSPMTAVSRAFDQHKANVLESLREDFAEMAPDLVAQLTERWTATKQ